MTQATQTTDCDLEIDAIGLACPMPLLKAKQGLSRLSHGQTLRLMASDPGSERDVKTFAKLSLHTLLHFERQDELYIYVLQKCDSAQLTGQK